MLQMMKGKPENHGGHQLVAEFIQIKAPVAMQRTTLAKALVRDQANPCEVYRVRVSAAKVENVEKAPQKPTVSNMNNGWDLDGQPAAPAEA